MEGSLYELSSLHGQKRAVLGRHNVHPLQMELQRLYQVVPGTAVITLHHKTARVLLIRHEFKPVRNAHSWLPAAPGAGRFGPVASRVNGRGVSGSRRP